MEKEFEKVPGDMVWVMHDNKAVCACIRKVFFCYGISCFDFTSIKENEKYELYADEKYIGSFKLKDMFPSKADLINSL